MQAAHGQLLSVKSRISKTTKRINQSYYWPNMEADIGKYIEKEDSSISKDQKF
jgi:hypothetical protein